MEDDLWTFIDRYVPISTNQAFKSQALFAGRPLGAIWDHVVIAKAGKLADVNYVRGLGIAILCCVGLLLFQFLKKVFHERVIALSVSMSVVLLPCFQSPALKYFEMNSLVSCLMSLFSAWIVINKYDESNRLRSAWYAVFALFVSVGALAMYQHSALLFYAAVLFFVLENALNDIEKFPVEKVLVACSVPAAGMLCYLLIYKAFFLQHGDQSLVVSATDILNRFEWFAKFPLQMGMDYFNLLSPRSYVLPFFDSATSYIFIFSSVVVFTGLVLLFVFYRRHRMLVRVAVVAIVFVTIFGAVGPSLLSNTVGSAYRRLQPLQTIFFVLTMFVLYVATKSLRHNARAVIFVSLFLALALRTHAVVGYKVDIVSREFLHIRSTLSSCFNKDGLVHFLTSPVYANSQDFVGLMTNFKPWIPGVTLVVLQDISFEDKATALALKEWTLGTATDQVTSSTVEEFKSDIFLPPGACLVDMAPVAEYVKDGLGWEEHPFGAADNAQAKHVRSVMPMSSDIEMFTDVERPLSSGNQPGYPAAMAFDADYIHSRWASGQVGSDINGTAYLGAEYRHEAEVDGFILRQGGAISTVQVEYSLDGQRWVAAGSNVQLVPDSNVHLYKASVTGPSARFWRIKAAAVLPYPAAWSVYELTFVQFVKR